MDRHVEVIAHPLNISQPRNAMRQQTSAGRDGTGSNSRVTNSENCAEVAVVIFVVLHIVFTFQSIRIVSG